MSTSIFDQILMFVKQKKVNVLKVRAKLATLFSIITQMLCQWNERKCKKQNNIAAHGDIFNCSQKGVNPHTGDAKTRESSVDWVSVSVQMNYVPVSSKFRILSHRFTSRVKSL